MQATTAKQQWVLNYLGQRPGVFVSPTEIGKAYKKENGLDKAYYDSSDYSGWASPHCKALVAKGLAERSPKGQYKFVKQADLTSAEPTKAGVSGVVAASGSTGTPAKSVGRINEEERLRYNEKNGFIRVAVLSNGLEIYKKKNAAGGWTYYGEGNAIFSTLWDSAIGTKEEFLAIAQDLYNMGLQIIVTSVESTGLQNAKPAFKYEINQLVYYMKNNLIHSARVLSRTKTENHITSVHTPQQRDFFNRFGPDVIVYATCHGEFPEQSVFSSKEDLVKSL